MNFGGMRLNPMANGFMLMKTKIILIPISVGIVVGYKGVVERVFDPKMIC